MQFSGVLMAPLLFILLPLSKAEAIVYWSIISFIIGLIVILILMRPDMKSTDFRDPRMGVGEIILWSIAGVFMAYVAQALSVFIELHVFNVKLSSENTQMIMDITRLTPLFMIIPAVIAPILEEIIFRKIIFGSLYRKTNFFIAAILSAGIFGIIHGEPEHLLIYTSMGFVFAFLYVKTKRIIVPILVHMTLNSITVVGQYFFDLEDLEKIQDNVEKLQFIIGG